MSYVEIELEAAPAERYVAVGFGALIACLVLYGLKFAFDLTFGALLRVVGDAVGHVPLVGGSLKGAVKGAAAFVDGEIADAALSCEGVAVRFFLGLWHLAKADAETIAYVAESTLGALEQLATVTVPRIAGESVHGWVAWFGAAYREVRHAADRALHGIDALEGKVEHKLRGIEAGVGADISAVEHAVDHTLPALVGREVGDLRHYVDEHLGALDRLIEHRYRLALEAASAGAVIAAVLRFFPKLACPNVRSLANHACKFPVRLLELLLAGEVAALALEETCQIATGVEAVADHSLPLLEKWLLLTPFVCRGGALNLPSAYTDPTPMHHATRASVI